jgi:hypothetical protein
MEAHEKYFSGKEKKKKPCMNMTGSGASKTTWRIKK